jgi:hypothetical protein
METPPRDFIMEEVKSLRNELQERNRAVQKLVVWSVAGSFSLLAFAVKETGLANGTVGAGSLWSLVCAAIPAVVMPILTLWFAGEVHSAHRIALFVRRVSEPALSSPEGTPKTISWEQFIDRWGELKRNIERCDGKGSVCAINSRDKPTNSTPECNPDSQAPDTPRPVQTYPRRCRPCGRWHIEKRLWEHPGHLAMQVMMVISFVAVLLAGWGSWKRVGVIFIIFLVVFLFTRLINVYPNMRAMHGIRRIVPSCKHWDSIRREVFEDLELHRQKPSNAT